MSNSSVLSTYSRDIASAHAVLLVTVITSQYKLATSHDITDYLDDLYLVKFSQSVTTVLNYTAKT